MRPSKQGQGHRWLLFFPIFSSVSTIGRSLKPKSKGAWESHSVESSLSRYQAERKRAGNGSGESGGE